MVDVAAKAIPAVAHGGLLHAELEPLGLAAPDVLDVSVNVNPYGPCEAVLDAVRGADLHRYPDPLASPARRVLASWLGVTEDRVVVGNGAVDLIWTLARAVLRPGDVALTVEPTFSEMRAAAVRTGARVVAFMTDPGRDFTLDVASLDETLARLAPRLLYLCSPSNPAGRATPAGLLGELAARHPSTLVVADVSFLSLSVHHAEAVWHSSDRVVWLKSLTKDHALAGLRVGCAVAPADIATRLEQERPPWSVNAMAQAAVPAIVTETAQRFLDASRARLLDDRAHLEEALGRLPLHLHPSETVFVLAGLRGGASATALRARLLGRHQVLVRDCTSFGLPHHVRLAARPATDTARLITALTAELP